MDINDLWNWALDTNAIIEENNDAEEMIERMSDLLITKVQKKVVAV